MQEIENCACMRRVLHKGRCCLLNSADTETALAALRSRHAGLFREEGQEAFRPSRPPHLHISYQCPCFLLALTEMPAEGNAARSSRSSQSKWSVFQRSLGGIGKPCARMLYFLKNPLLNLGKIQSKGGVLHMKTLKAKT